MATYSTSEFKSGLKLMIDGDPFSVLENEFVRPGKGQAFNRVKLKNLKTGRVIERTFKSGERVDLADIEEAKMRMLYKEPGAIIFMDEKTYEQHTIPLSIIGDKEPWFMEEIEYDIVF